MQTRLLLATMVSLACFAIAAADDNWPMFRGPHADGMAPQGKLPEEWTESKNVAWKTPIPGLGWSSPIVWGQKVFLTTATSEGKDDAPGKGLYMGRTPK